MPHADYRAAIPWPTSAAGSPRTAAGRSARCPQTSHAKSWRAAPFPVHGLRLPCPKTSFRCLDGHGEPALDWRFTGGVTHAKAYRSVALSECAGARRGWADGRLRSGCQRRRQRQPGALIRSLYRGGFKPGGCIGIRRGFEAALHLRFLPRHGHVADSGRMRDSRSTSVPQAGTLDRARPGARGALPRSARGRSASRPPGCCAIAA